MEARSARRVGRIPLFDTVIDSAQFGVDGKIPFGLFARVHDGCVIAPGEVVADGLKGFVRQLSHHEHGQASCADDSGFSGGSSQGIERKLELFGDELEQLFAGDF